MRCYKIDMRREFTKCSFIQIVGIMLLVACAAGCSKLDDDRIPVYSAHIDISNQGMWTIYGVNGLGTYRYFSVDRRQPGNFPFNATTYTGFGGILLMDAGIGECKPVAYDMACPNERKKTVVVAIDDETLEAVCPSCWSRYDVLTGYGQAISGPAHTHKYALRRYRVTQSSYGGFIISN